MENMNIETQHRITLELPFKFGTLLFGVTKFFHNHTPHYQTVPLHFWSYTLSKHGLMILVDEDRFTHKYPIQDCFVDQDEADAECERRSR